MRRLAIANELLRRALSLALGLALLAACASSIAHAQIPSPSMLAEPSPPGAATPASNAAPATEPKVDPPANLATADPPLTLERLPADAQWYEAQYWLPPDIWSGSFEIGINGAEGNAQSFSMQVGGNLKRKTDWDQLEVKITHAKTNSNGVITQNNAIFNAREEILFGESPWSLFENTYLEYDEFKAFDLRLAENGGVGYQFAKNDVWKLKGRFGAGVSREFGGPDDSWVPEGVFGFDFERQLGKAQKLTATIDYFPSWSDFADYRIVTNVGWEILIDELSNMSLKVGLIDRYDSTPNGLLANDINYSLVLIWKM